MTDQAIREQALNPQHSFIVQAPAGSGKTELLTQRFLTLLNHCEKAPEEIIAITFTKKAAAEMRERVICALQFAEKTTQAPDEAHKRLTWQLAQTALKKDQSLSWQLIKNPNRLRIMTIDALAGFISRQIPLLSGLGAPASLIEQPEELYQQAVLNLFEQLNEKNDYQLALNTLLLHLDNNSEQLTRLLMHILSKREQWLGHLITHRHQQNARSLLEESLEHVLEDILAGAKTAFQPYEPTIMPLIEEAIASQASPTQHPDDLSLWQKIANLLLTRDGHFRKTIDRRQGFAPDNPHKKPLKALLEQLSDEASELEQALQEVLTAPPIHYNEQQWKILSSLFTLLPLLVAELQLLFKTEGVIDFVELSQTALRALGDEDNPTDLALHLDYQIRHLLIDEFQDTSVTQFRLVEKLIAGWEHDDGRSLFLVGDPMQSIYRFREAEVGLFLKVQQSGIGSIQPTSLVLTQNFRSSCHLIEWINQSMEAIFPERANIDLGAVTYTPAQAVKNLNHSDVHAHAITDTSNSAEAQKVVERIRHYQQCDNKKRIAILVRSRSHLLRITRELKLQKIAYQAVDIDPITQHLIIRDLLNLTRALCHLDDRVAWLSVLRAPWCGISLHDLQILSHHRPLIWESLLDIDSLPLSTQAKQATKRLSTMLQHAFEERGQQPLSLWLKGIWFSLGGPAALESNEQLHQAKQYFDHLSEYVQQHTVFDVYHFSEYLQTCFTQAQENAENPVQIMTIHKSKGLEFDHVILPGLHKGTANDASQLLLWLERPRTENHDLLLAPIKSSMESKDLIYRYLAQQHKQKLEYEHQRLLYVALTRAKQTLDLTFHVEIDDENQATAITKNSFLALLWPQLKCKTILPVPTEHEALEETPDFSKLRRLAANWELPHYQQHSLHPKTFTRTQSFTNNPLQEANDTSPAKISGIIIHSLLEQFGKIGKIPEISLAIQQRLSSYSLDPETQNKISNTCQLAIENTLNDPRAQWVLKPRKISHCEYSISQKRNQELHHFIIDRWFIEDDKIWIIDYKTAETSKAALQQYQHQLNHYASLLHQLHKLPVVLGLYFTHNQDWMSWEYQAITESV